MTEGLSLDMTEEGTFDLFIEALLVMVEKGSVKDVEVSHSSSDSLPSNPGTDGIPLGFSATRMESSSYMITGLFLSHSLSEQEPGV